MQTREMEMSLCQFLSLYQVKKTSKLKLKAFADDRIKV